MNADQIRVLLAPTEPGERFLYREIERQHKLAELVHVLLPIVESADGLSRGVDWNNGTHAKHYREPLLTALEAWRKL